MGPLVLDSCFPRRLGALALLAAACGCTGELSIFDAHGPAASAIADAWWVTLALTITPALVVIGVLFFALFHRRHGAPAAASRARRKDWIVVLCGGVLPAAILLAIMVVTFKLAAEVSRKPESSPLTVDVVGHQFWWEVHYPEHGIVTANEIHVPVGSPVRFRVTSADVIHSFWVPKLQGKLDMLPGRIQEIWLQADDSGVYRGQCAEFCGLQHALMAFELVALPQADFSLWLEERKRGRLRSAPTDVLAQRGQQVYFDAECAHCHSIAGVTRPGPTRAVGPDLTHLASRRTLGAVLMPNNRGNLGGWILEPEALKPGIRMPPSSLAPADLHALLHYLESLR